MQIYAFSRLGEMPRHLETVDALPDEGFLWLDFVRSEAAHWPQWAEKLAGVKVYDDHVTDSFNGDHISAFDATDDYDMLIFQALTPEECENHRNLIVTKSAAFMLFDRLLITVHAPENVSFDRVKKRFCESKLRFPSTPFGLTHAILEMMVSRYTHVIDELEDRMEHLADLLLDPKSAFADWRVLLHYRKQAHALELLCEHNQATVDVWKREMRIQLSEGQRIRMDDLREQLGRLMNHADSIQRDIEVAMQLHFSSVAHRTNRIVQNLTVLSAIFFPLTLLTGIWGMNFEFMPELHWRYGYAFALTMIFGIGTGLLLFFRKRRFF